MSDNLVTSLSSALAAPSSLQELRKGQGYFLDDHTPAIPSEGNMLTLLTMKDLFKDGGDEEAKAALGAIAKEESKYLMQAMKVLSSETSGDGGDSIRRMQDKFGKDMAGATQLAQLLKNESIKQEYEDIKKFVDSEVFARKQPGALKPAKVYKGGAQ